MAGKLPPGLFVEEPAAAPVIDIVEWAKKNKRSRSKTIPDKRFAGAVSAAVRCMASGDWRDAGTLTFVGLYVHLHEGVYGVPPAELGPTERLRAAGLARRMLDRDFDGDPAAMADFMRWTWQREKGREQWRRENQNGGSRISWVQQFGGRMLTDYRVDLARAKARR